MTVFAYLISDDLQEGHLCLHFKKRAGAMGVEQPIGPFQTWAWGEMIRMLE